MNIIIRKITIVLKVKKKRLPEEAFKKEKHFKRQS